jgi:hypothetical protein
VLFSLLALPLCLNSLKKLCSRSCINDDGINKVTPLSLRPLAISHPFMTVLTSRYTMRGSGLIVMKVRHGAYFPRTQATLTDS